MSKLEIINKEINEEIAKPEVERALIATTFKGLEPKVMKQAIMEGMMRGFTFKDFLEKNVYAIPFRNGYSLITSIDYARKLGMRSGIVGKLAPMYEVGSDGKIVSCTITVKRKVDDYVGEYSATVFWDEYTTGKNLWVTKPRTMIAKVAEMHALRMACPEELAQSYIEEEMEKESIETTVEYNIDEYQKKLEATKNKEELKKVWSSIPPKVKTELENLKDELKKKYENS